MAIRVHGSHTPGIDQAYTALHDISIIPGDHPSE